MTAEIIDGKAFAADLRGRIASHVPDFVAQTGRKPGLAVVLVGEDPASQVYVRSKGKSTVECGMNSFEHKRDADISMKELLALVAQLNADPLVDGILVQLPLPAHLDEAAVIDAIDPDKDVDGFHVVNAGRLAVGKTGFVPCTPLGCIMLLKDRLGADLAGKDAVVIGRSNIVGKPMAQLLLQESCTVTIAHSRTANLPNVVRRADIVVAAVGRPEMVKGDWIKPGAIVIDVGINRVPGGEAGKTKLVGDVAYAEAAAHAAAITPVPGGVGPMTIAVLLRNTLVAAYARSGLKAPGFAVISLFLSAFITLFVVIDPPGCAPIFASLTGNSTDAHRRVMALRSVATATIILLIFSIFGEALLGHLGISLDAFRIAGGILLFLIALEMIFERRTARREDRADKVAQRAAAEDHQIEEEDISVFPMGIPMIAGPGSIATVILQNSRAEGMVQSLTVIAALLAVLAVTLIMLVAASPFMRVLGPKLEAMLTRVLGILLAALAIQFVIDGIKASFLA